MTYINLSNAYGAETTHNVDEQSVSIHIDDNNLDATAHINETRLCIYCDTGVEEYGDDWLHEDTGSIYCDETLDPTRMTPEDRREALESFDSVDEYRNEHGAATPYLVAPGNWVGFTLDAVGGTTQVQISLGDPRGCLTMTVRKAVDPTTGQACLMLDLPYEGEGAAHVDLEHIYGGTFRIK